MLYKTIIEEETPTMTFRIHTPETAPAASKDILGVIEKKYGFLPNLAGVFAESAAALNGFVALAGAYDSPEMTLTPIERQVVLLAVSVRNRCEYCAAAHGTLAHMVGLDRAEIESLQESRPLSDARLNVLRKFTETVVEARGWTSEADLEKFFAAGFTKAQVFEVIHGVALKTLTNYVNHIAKPALNTQFAEFRPKWPKAA